MSGFVHFYSKRGIAYADWRVSVRQGDKVTHERRNLGRVVDRDRLIFKRRGEQPYGITSDGTPRELTAEELATLAAKDDATDTATWGAEHDPVDFGDALFVVSYLRQMGLAQVLEDICEDRADMALCLFVYQILYPSGTLDCLAAWWKGSYACYLFPHIVLDAQGIRSCLEELGRKDVLERLIGACAELSGDENGRQSDSQPVGAVPSTFDADSPTNFGRKVLVDLAVTVRRHLQRDLTARTAADVSAALMSLRNHKARAYDRALVPLPPAPENAMIYDAFGIVVPAVIPLGHHDPRLALDVSEILGDDLDA